MTLFKKLYPQKSDSLELTLDSLDLLIKDMLSVVEDTKQAVTNSYSSLIKLIHAVVKSDANKSRWMFAMVMSQPDRALIVNREVLEHINEHIGDYNLRFDFDNPEVVTLDVLTVEESETEKVDEE